MGWAVLLASLLVALGASLAPAQDQALREAAQLDAEGKCGEAERIYRQALAAGPPSPALLNNLGNHYLVCGQPEKARNCFERLLAAKPAHGNANLQMARLETARRQGAKALEYLARVQDAGPAVRLLRAEASFYAGQAAAAKTLLDALEKDALEKGGRGDPRLLFAIGETALRMGLYDRAEAAFNGVLASRPDDFDVLLNLGRAAARAQHYDRALSALDAAARLRPRDAGALLELGLLHAARQDYSRAVYLLAQARQQAPGRPDVLLALARAADDAGYYGDSALAYDAYLALRPEDDTARRDRATVCARTVTRKAEGLGELARYVQKHPGDPIGYYDLAQFSWEKDPQKSLDQLSTALRLDPAFAPAYYARAWLLHRFGRAEESLPDLEAALRIAPGNWRARDQLGLAYLALDRPAEAEKALRPALAAAPDDPEVLLHLARALMALGREDEAQPFVDRFKKARSRRTRDPRQEPGMIELATLPQAERIRRETERLRRDARANPTDAELQLGLASLLLAGGSMDEGTAEFRELLNRNADSRIGYEAGRSLLRAGQYELARRFLERAAAELPGANLDLALVLLLTSAPQEALAAIQRVPEGVQEGDRLLLLARILDAAGQRAAADEVLERGLRQSPSRPEVVRQAVALLLRDDRGVQARDLLARATRAHPDNPDLLLIEAILTGLADRPSEAEKMLKQIESRWPEWEAPYVAHGLLLERQGRPGEARQKLGIAAALGATVTAGRCALATLILSSCGGE